MVTTLQTAQLKLDEIFDFASFAGLSPCATLRTSVCATFIRLTASEMSEQPKKPTDYAHEYRAKQQEEEEGQNVHSDLWYREWEFHPTSGVGTPSY